MEPQITMYEEGRAHYLKIQYKYRQKLFKSVNKNEMSELQFAVESKYFKDKEQ